MKSSQKRITIVIFTIFVALLALVPTIASELPRGDGIDYDSQASRNEQVSSPVSQEVPYAKVGTEDMVTGNWIIHFDPGTPETEKIIFIQSLGASIVERIDPLDVIVVQAPQYSAASNFSFDNNVVDLIEQDFLVYADFSIPPNDPQYKDQWALSHIQAEAAWKDMPQNLKPVTVAVVDTGVCMTHEDLVGRVLKNGYDFVDNDDNPEDIFGHGCSVAGIIAANIDNGIGISGFAPNASILPIRVLGANGSGSVSDVAKGIVYAVDNGADIVNLSLGSMMGSQVEKDAVDYAEQKGVLVIASSGNSAGKLPGFPARYDSVVAVGAIDPNGGRSSFSNLGGDIWAPGRDVLTIYKGNTYKALNGTSFSAPYVSAMAAVLMGMDKELNLDGGDMTWGCMMQGTCEVVPGS